MLDLVQHLIECVRIAKLIRSEIRDGYGVARPGNPGFP
jgi:hypothetical protein